MTTGVGAATVVATGHCRVTVVSGGTRADLSLPETVPVAELLGEVARFVPAPPGDGLRLARLGGEPLHGDRTLADQQVLSGELLTLVAGDPLPAPVVVDDVVTAVTAAVDGRRDLWTRRDAPRWAVPGGAVVAAVGALPLLLERPGWGDAAAAGAAALVLGALAALAARRRLPLARGWLVAVAVLFGAVAGADLAAAAGSGSLASMLAAGGAGAVVAGGAAAAATRRARGLVAVAAAGGTLALAGVAGTFLDAPPARVAAVAALVWLWLCALADRVVPGLVGLRAPTRAAPVLRGDAVRSTHRRVERGHEVLGELMLAAAVVVAAATGVLGLTGGAWSWATAGVAAVAVALRARRFRLVREVVPLAAAGGVGLLCLGCRLVLGVGPQPWLAAVFVAAGVLLALVALVVARLDVGAAVGLAVDRLEVLVLVALVPLALGVLGVYGSAAALGTSLH